MVIFALPDRLATAEGNDPTAVIIVPTDAAAEKAAAILNHVGREILSRRSSYRVVDLREKLLQDVSEPELKAYQKATALVGEATEHYQNLEIEKAVAKLEDALGLFQKAIGRMGRGDKYYEALTLLGAAQLIGGDGKLGVDAFRRAALYDPTRTLDQKMFPPTIFEEFEKQRKDIAKLRPCSLVVEGSPAGAEVFLDGVFKGITPTKLAGVPEGKHFVRLEKEGYFPLGQILEFTFAREEILNDNLKPTPNLAKWEQYRALVLDQIKRKRPEKPLLDMAAWLQASKLVIGRVAKSSGEATVEVAIIQVDPPKKVKSKRAVLKNPSEADAFFASLFE